MDCIKINMICDNTIFSHCLDFNDGVPSLPCPSVFAVSFAALLPSNSLRAPWAFFSNRDYFSYLFCLCINLLSKFYFCLLSSPLLSFFRRHLRILCRIIFYAFRTFATFPSQDNTIFHIFLGPFLSFIPSLLSSPTFRVILVYIQILRVFPHILFVILLPFGLPNKSEQFFSAGEP